MIATTMADTPNATHSAGYRRMQRRQRKTDLLGLCSADAATKKATLTACLDTFNELAGVLGLLYVTEEANLDGEIEALIEERTAARKNKDFKRADEIRDQLKNMGIILEDTPQGVKWTRQ